MAMNRGLMTTKKETGTQMTIDYREAFVLDMELSAHGFSCRQCQLAALKGKPDDFCDQMKHMREYIRSAYQALPKYYKDRYEAAMNSAIKENQAALEDVGIHFNG